MNPPRNPSGEHVDVAQLSPERRLELIATVARAPGCLKAAVLDLNDQQLETRYVNWSIRQITHHLADSHIHCYARFKWALVEDHPTIKPYNETLTAELVDSQRGDIQPALALYEGIHARWTQLLRTMTADQFARTFYHPESKKNVTLDSALNYYAWHARHHTAQIQWLRDANKW